MNSCASQHGPDNPIFLNIEYLERENFICAKTFMVVSKPWVLHTAKILLFTKERYCRIFDELPIPKIRHLRFAFGILQTTLAHKRETFSTKCALQYEHLWIVGWLLTNSYSNHLIQSDYFCMPNNFLTTVSFVTFPIIFYSSWTLADLFIKHQTLSPIDRNNVNLSN